MSAKPELLEADLTDWSIPRGADDEPVFAAPWEARIFALMVLLARRRHVPWADFSTALGTEIERHPLHLRTAAHYYRHWLAAAESLLESEELLDWDGILSAEGDILAEYGSHDH